MSVGRSKDQISLNGDRDMMVISLWEIWFYINKLICDKIYFRVFTSVYKNMF